MLVSISRSALKPAREHATTIDSEIQRWHPDANFRNHQIRMQYALGLTQWKIGPPPVCLHFRVVVISLE